MASPSVTYTLANGTTADATKLNQNYADLIAAMTDGSKTFSIDTLTVAGTLNANGAVNLGNATSDDITVTGYIASNVLPKTDNTYALGSAAKKYSSLYCGGTVTAAGLSLGNETISAYDEGTFDCYLRQASETSIVKVTMTYVILGKIALLSICTAEAAITSTNTILYLSSAAASNDWPSALRPATDQRTSIRIRDNSTYPATLGMFYISGQTVTLSKDMSGAGFTAANLKGVAYCNIIYSLL